MKYIQIVTHFKKDARDKRQITKPEKAGKKTTKNPSVI